MVQNESPSGQDPAQAIRLVPVPAGALGKVATGSANADSAGNQINLDTITGTVTEYFMIQNTGNVDISDIEIRTDNPNFSFQPSHIALLAPANQLNVQQILALTITHGAITSDSSPIAATLKPGLNTATVSVSGSSLDKLNAPLAISESIGLTAYAKLVDIAVRDQTGAIDLFHPWGKSWGALAPDAYPIYSATGDSLTLINTGNVALDLNYWKDPDSAAVDVKIGVNDSARLPVPATMALDGGNVTTDPNKLPMSKNGKVYALFMNTQNVSSGSLTGE